LTLEFFIFILIAVAVIAATNAMHAAPLPCVGTLLLLLQGTPRRKTVKVDYINFTKVARQF